MEQEENLLLTYGNVEITLMSAWKIVGLIPLKNK
jgi:hypothetical protein